MKSIKLNITDELYELLLEGYQQKEVPTDPAILQFPYLLIGQILANVQKGQEFVLLDTVAENAVTGGLQ